MIDVELRWQSGKKTPVEIRVVPNQGSPLRTVTAEDVDESQVLIEHEIDGYVLRSRTSLIDSLAAWARLLSAQDEEAVRARCLESRAPVVVTFLDPTNSGSRPIPVDVPPPPADD